MTQRIHIQKKYISFQSSNHQQILSLSSLFSPHSHTNHLPLNPHFHNCSLCLSVFPSPPPLFISVIPYSFFMDVGSIAQQNFHNFTLAIINCIVQWSLKKCKNQKYISVPSLVNVNIPSVIKYITLCIIHQSIWKSSPSPNPHSLSLFLRILHEFDGSCDIPSFSYPIMCTP